MRILIVEDSIERIKTFKQKLIGHEVWVATQSSQAIDFLENQDPFDYCFLDHDLVGVYQQSGKGTGYEVAQWIANHPDKKPSRITIHSLNNVGASNMLHVLGDAGIVAKYAPFAWMHLQPSSPKLPNCEEIEIKTAIILKNNCH